MFNYYYYILDAGFEEINDYIYLLPREYLNVTFNQKHYEQFLEYNKRAEDKSRKRKRYMMYNLEIINLWYNLRKI